MLIQRIITALVLLPLVLCALFLLDMDMFSWFVAAIAAIAGWEWARLSGFSSQLHRLGYGFLIAAIIWQCMDVADHSLLYASFVWWLLALGLVVTFPGSSVLWRAPWVRLLLGILILVPFWFGVVFLRSGYLVPFPELSPLWLVFYAMFIVFAADTGAYFSGKAWGKAKLAPKVSPGKSWAGFFGGMVSACCLALLAAYFLKASVSMTIQIVLVSAITAIFSVVGDLTESMFKRHAGIKDSSKLLPGHGGVLDRIDSLTAAFPVLACLLLLLGWAR